jgi:hypothetical protein
MTACLPIRICTLVQYNQVDASKIAVQQGDATTVMYTHREPDQQVSIEVAALALLVTMAALPGCVNVDTAYFC